MKEIFKTHMDGSRVVIDETQPLTEYKKSDEHGVLNLFFEKDGRKFFFKANSSYTLDVSELLSYALTKEVDSNSVEFLPAVYVKDGKRYNGVISEDILKNSKEDKLVNGASFLRVFEGKNAEEEAGKRKERFNTIEHYKMALSLFARAKNGNDVSVDKNFFIDLAKHMITSFIRADEDIHAHNLPIVIRKTSENKQVIEMGKLFDNSMSLLLKSHRVNIRDDFESLTPQQKDTKITHSLEEIGFPFQVKASSNRQTGRQWISREIASLILKYPVLKDHYEAYKKLNVKKVLSNFKKEQNYDFIKDSDIELASMVVKNSLNLLEKAIEFENYQKTGPMRHFKKDANEPDLEF